MPLRDRHGILNDKARDIEASGDAEVGALLERTLRIIESQGRTIAEQGKRIDALLRRTEALERRPKASLFEDIFGPPFPPGPTR